MEKKRRHSPLRQPRLFQYFSTNQKNQSQAKDEASDNHTVVTNVCSSATICVDTQSSTRPYIGMQHASAASDTLDDVSKRSRTSYLTLLDSCYANTYQRPTPPGPGASDEAMKEFETMMYQWEETQMRLQTNQAILQSQEEANRKRQKDELLLKQLRIHGRIFDPSNTVFNSSILLDKCFSIKALLTFFDAVQSVHNSSERLPRTLIDQCRLTYVDHFLQTFDPESFPNLDDLTQTQETNTTKESVNDFLQSIAHLIMCVFSLQFLTKAFIPMACNVYDQENTENHQWASSTLHKTTKGGTTKEGPTLEDTTKENDTEHEVTKINSVNATHVSKNISEANETHSNVHTTNISTRDQASNLVVSRSVSLRNIHELLNHSSKAELQKLFIHICNPDDWDTNIIDAFGSLRYKLVDLLLLEIQTLRFYPTYGARYLWYLSDTLTDLFQEHTNTLDVSTWSSHANTIANTVRQYVSSLHDAMFVLAPSVAGGTPELLRDIPTEYTYIRRSKSGKWKRLNKNKIVSESEDKASTRQYSQIKTDTSSDSDNDSDILEIVEDVPPTESTDNNVILDE